jgi:hypothetical protein
VVAAVWALALGDVKVETTWDGASCSGSRGPIGCESGSRVGASAARLVLADVSNVAVVASVIGDDAGSGKDIEDDDGEAEEEDDEESVSDDGGRSEMAFTSLSFPLPLSRADSAASLETTGVSCGAAGGGGAAGVSIVVGEEAGLDKRRCRCQDPRVDRRRSSLSPSTVAEGDSNEEDGEEGSMSVAGEERDGFTR